MNRRKKVECVLVITTLVVAVVFLIVVLPGMMHPRLKLTGSIYCNVWPVNVTERGILEVVDNSHGTQILQDSGFFGYNIELDDTFTMIFKPPNVPKNECQVKNLILKTPDGTLYFTEMPNGNWARTVTLSGAIYDMEVTILYDTPQTRAQVANQPLIIALVAMAFIMIVVIPLVLVSTDKQTEPEPLGT